MTHEQLRYGDRVIPYQVSFGPERRRRVAIHVYPDGSVRVKAPTGTPLPAIRQAVGKRSRWIYFHLQRFGSQRSQVLPREYVSGESHFYLGRCYLLKVMNCADMSPSVRLLRGQFQINSHSSEQTVVRSLLWNWYREHAHQVFDRRLTEISKHLPWVESVPEWRLLTMRRQWGSCSPHGRLTLNTHLVKAPPDCIDYVLLHELCHLQEHNHSLRYYQLLARYMPNWQAVKARLDGMSEGLLKI